MLKFLSKLNEKFKEALVFVQIDCSFGFVSLIVIFCRSVDIFRSFILFIDWYRTYLVAM